MATSQDAISRLQIQATTQGVDEATDSLNKLAAAQGGVAVASASVEKTTQSLDGKFGSIEKRYVDGVAAQQSYAKVQQTVNAAVAQNPALTDRANTVLAAAKQRYEDLTHTQTTFEKGLESAKDKASELTRELGPMGTVLTALGPAGLAVGAAIGVAVLALGKLKEEADEAGRWAKQLQDAANVIGINTEQLQALNEAAARAGVTAADNVAGFEKFAVSLGQLKDGSGQLYTQLQKINPSLAAQLSNAKDAATGWNLLAQAYASADKQQQALLARAAFGRGGAAQGQVLLATAQAGGIAGLQAQNEDTISKDQIKRWADLTTQINQATEAAQHNFQSIFTDAILTMEKNFADNMLSISRYAKEFSLSDGWTKFIDFVSNPTTQTVLGVLVRLTPVGLAASAINALTSSRPKSMADFQSPANSYSTFQAPATSTPANDNGPGSPSYEAARLRDLVAALGGAATARDHYNATIAASEAVLDVASKSADADALGVAKGVAARVQANAGLELATALQNAHNSALGQSASVADLVAAKSNQLAKLQQQGAGLTQAQIENQKRLTASQALGTFQIDAQSDAEKVKIATLTMSTQSAIAYEIVQTKINEAIALGKPLTDDQIAKLRQSANAFAQNKVAADQLTEAVHLLRDSTASFASGFVKDLAAGQPAIKALQSALASLASTLVDAAIKPLVTKAIDSVAEAIGSAASGTAGATASATILTTAGTTLAAQMVAGATQAAAILTGSGAAAGTEVAAGGAAGGTEVAAGGGVAGTEVAAGGATAGTALAAGGTAASIAILGPLALLLAAVAAAAAAIGLGNNDAAEENRRQVLAASQDRSLGYLARAQLAGVDTSTREGALQAQEIQFAEERRKDGGDGIYRNGALVAAQEAERLALIKQWDAKDLAELNASNEAKAAAEKQALEESLKRQLSYQDRLFNATTDTSTLAGALAAFDRKSNQERIDEMAAGGQAINDLVAAQEAERLNIYKQFNDAAVEAQKAAADAAHEIAQQTADYVKGVAKSINDFLQGLKTGANSILNPQDRLAAAQSLFDSQIGLAKTGDKDALSNITQTAQALLDQAKSFYASGAGYVQVYNAVTSSLTNLGYQNGGVIPGYASGGMVGNGIFGVDSVLASFAGGGNIALAGGEFVMPAAQTRAHLPQLEAMRSGASNDNAINSLGQQLVRAMVGVSGAEMNAWREDNADMRALLLRLISAVQGNKPPVPRPGSETKPKAA